MTTRDLIDAAVHHAKMNQMHSPREAQIDRHTLQRLCHELEPTVTSVGFSGEYWMNRVVGATVCYNGVAMIPMDVDGFYLKIT